MFTEHKIDPERNISTKLEMVNLLAYGILKTKHGINYRLKNA